MASTLYDFVYATPTSDGGTGDRGGQVRGSQHLAPDTVLKIHAEPATAA